MDGKYEANTSLPRASAAPQVPDTPGLAFETGEGKDQTVTVLPFRQLLLNGRDQRRLVWRSIWSEPLHNLSLAADQKLLKVPHDLRLGVGIDSIPLQLLAKWNLGQADGCGLRFNQRRIQRMLLLAYHCDLVIE